MDEPATAAHIHMDSLWRSPIEQQTEQIQASEMADVAAARRGGRRSTKARPSHEAHPVGISNANSVRS